MLTDSFYRGPIVKLVVTKSSVANKLDSTWEVRSVIDFDSNNDSNIVDIVRERSCVYIPVTDVENWTTGTKLVRRLFDVNSKQESWIAL